MADDTDTTRPGEAEAAEVAARVLAHGLGWREPAQLHTDAAEEIVAAAYPVIAAAVREQAAQDIEAMRAQHFAEYGNEETGPRNHDWALTHAARIVRGGR